MRPLFPKINIVRILEEFKNVTDCASIFSFTVDGMLSLDSMESFGYNYFYAMTS